MSDENRRNVLKKVTAVGTAGIVGSTLSQTVAAEELGIQSDKLPQEELSQQFESALTTRSAKAMKDFLEKEKQVTFKTSEIDGALVSPPEGVPDHIVLQIPIQSRLGEDGVVSIRLFDEYGEATDVTAILGDESFKSNPGVHRGLNEDIVPVSEWVEYKQNRGQREGVTQQISVGTDKCVTQDLGSICHYLATAGFVGGIIGSAVLIFIPDPVTTVSGAAAASAIFTGGVKVAGASATGCAVSETIDQVAPMVDDCDFNTVNMCFDWSAYVGWDGVGYDLDLYVSPSECV